MLSFFLFQKKFLHLFIYLLKITHKKYCMKKIIYALSLGLTVAASAQTVNAQVFNLEYIDNSNDTIFTNGVPNEIKTIVRLDLEPGIDSFNYSWKFSAFEKPIDWGFFGLCDNVTCHPYEVGSSINPYFQAPFASQDSTMYVYNKPGDPTFILDIPYLWFNIKPDASIGTGYFKYSITTRNVFPASAAPATPQVTEVVHIIRKNMTVSVDRLVINNNDIQIHPNPAQSEIKIATTKNFDLKNINIIDASGRVIMTAPVTNAQIDISKLSAGMYWVEFINKDGINLTTRKLLKQ